MRPEPVEPDPPAGPAQHKRRNHDVVGLAEDRDEVGDQIDRADEVDEHYREGHLRAARRRLVGEQRASEPNDIRNDPDGGTRQCTGWLRRSVVAAPPPSAP